MEEWGEKWGGRSVCGQVCVYMYRGVCVCVPISMCVRGMSEAMCV